MAESKDQKINRSFKTLYAFSFAWQLGFFIILPIVGFLFIGKWLDEKFGTAPIILVGGIVIGVVVTVYEVRSMMRPFINEKDDPEGELD